MKLLWISFCMAGLALPAMLLGGCAAKPATAEEGDPERGRYLVASLGCGDCHSPKVMGPQGPDEDETMLLAGHPEGNRLPPPPALSGPWIAAATWDQTAWTGPWGISYATNLTPDENTGIGSWSEETFTRSLKTGRHMGVSRPVLPPMPWQSLKNLTDEDLRAIYAFLRTIPPVHNRVPEPVPPGAGPAASASR
ncbi:MAG TPA: c-type cytochrome [Thermoanaerobaculia bacterium]